MRDFAPLLLPKKDDSGGSPIRMLDFACGNGLASWVRLSKAPSTIRISRH